MKGKAHKFRRPDKDRIKYNEFVSRFEYDKINGGMIRKSHKGKVGIVKSTGYHSIRIKHDGKMVDYFTHHLVFFYHNKRWPTEIGHLDDNKLNNRIENLKEMTRKENQSFRCRAVIRSDGKLYKSLAEAGEDSNTNTRAIWGSIANYRGRITAGGYRWRYA
jgi:hypothetical protein